MYKVQSSSFLLYLIVAIIGYGVVRFVIGFLAYRNRMKDLPGPPHQKLVGHGMVMAEAQQAYPSDLHPHTLPALVKEKYDLGRIFYLDFWPFAVSMMVISDPEIAQRILDTPKHWTLQDFLQWIAGPENMLAQTGEKWKMWRSVFNPGFAASYLATLVPQIVETGAVFCDILRENAEEKKLFRLEETATRLTIDVIARVTMDINLDSQRRDNEFIQALKRQINLMAFQLSLNPLARYNPVTLVSLYYNGWIMKKFMSKALRDRFESRRSAAPSKIKQKHIIDLALETYTAEEKEGMARKDKLDPTFERYAIAQLRVFFFAGFDTTSSTICYCLHMLEKHPDALAKVITEHNEVFGPDPEAAEALMKGDAKLLNKLEYTLAVIKEVLRLFPPASSIRGSSEPIIDPKTGISYPTEGFMVWILHTAIHRSPSNFTDPNAFRPERFLQPELASQKDHAWRPFEKGPRNCIGQELALLEIKIILVLVVRRFKVKVAYDEVMKLADDGMGWPKYKDEKASRGSVWGEEAYQSLRGSAKPRQGMPVRIEVR